MSRSDCSTEEPDAVVPHVRICGNRGCVSTRGDPVPVGWTSGSEVHRTPRRRWWTALRLSTLRCSFVKVAGIVIEAVQHKSRARRRSSSPWINLGRAAIAASGSKPTIRDSRWISRVRVFGCMLAKGSVVTSIRLECSRRERRTSLREWARRISLAAHGLHRGAEYQVIELGR